MQFLLLLAGLPCFLIVFLIYKADKKEKEPIGEIIKAFLMGFVSIIITLGISFILGIGNTTENMSYIQALKVSFIEIALIEETAKFLCGYIFVRKNKNYDCMFDGIVYFTAVSLGFAFVENILYIISGGITTALFRAVTTIPAHAFFGVFAGYYYSLYRKTKKDRYMFLSILIPVILHGCFDFFLIVGNVLFLIAFIIFLIVLYVVSILRIVKMSKNDEYIEIKEL